MQANVGSPIETVTASFIYAVRFGYSEPVINNDNQLRIFRGRAKDSPVPRWRSGPSPVEEAWTSTTVWQPGPQVAGDAAAHHLHRRGRRNRASLPERPDWVDLPISDLADLPESFEFTAISPLVDPAAVSQTAFAAAGDSNSLLPAVRNVVQWVYEKIVYRRGTTTVATTAGQVLEAGEGVCQDKTHLALGMLRALNIPSRYASGLIAGQTGETHSWVEFYHPDQGWLGADPTRGVILPPASDYVKLGVGRDYTDVSPVTGSFLSTGAAVDVAAIADVRLSNAAPTLEDALQLLEQAYVVHNDSGSSGYSLERPEKDL